MSLDDANFLRRRLADLCRVRDESRGEEIVRLQENLGISYRILEENYCELVAANERYLVDHGIEQPENARKLENFLLGFQRLLFNYLSSFISFVDHTEVLVKEMGDSRLEREFDEVRNENQIVEKMQFVKDLLDYLHFYRLPFPRVETGYLPTSEGLVTDTIPGFCKGEVSLRKEELLRWDGFNSVSKGFLRGHLGNVIVIVSYAGIGCVDECQAVTKELYEWLKTRVSELFCSEISDFLELQGRIEETSRELQSRWKKDFSGNP